MGNYNLRARDIMHPEVATILDDATVEEAASIMRMEGVRSLLIVPHDKEDSYGMVSYADIVSKIIADGLDPKIVRVDEIMTKPAITIPPTMEVKHIARLFRQTKIGHAPVVDGGGLLGMVSMTDLITEVITEPA